MESALVFESRFSGKVPVKLEVNSYMNNGRIYIGMTETGGEYPEPFADITVNIDAPCSPYCGYVDTNNCPELEEFIEKHNLGEFTGMTGNSGFCTYPLYMFHVDKLRELAPDDMEHFERTVMGIAPEREKENSIKTGGR